MNTKGIMAAFDRMLTKIREHLEAARKEAAKGASAEHTQLCYHFQLGTSLLVATLDGLAVYVETKVADRVKPADCDEVTWADQNVFGADNLKALWDIKERTYTYSIGGNVKVSSLRNLSKHFLPLLLTPSTNAKGHWDITLPVNAVGHPSGPLLSGLLFPLFNDACDAVREVHTLLKTKASMIPPLLDV